LCGNLRTHFHLVAALLNRRLHLITSTTTYDHLNGLAGINGILSRSGFLRLNLLRHVLVLSELNELLQRLARLIIEGMIHEVLQHIMLLPSHDLLILHKTIEELLELCATPGYESLCLAAESFLRGELR